MEGNNELTSPATMSKMHDNVESLKMRKLLHENNVITFILKYLFNYSMTSYLSRKVVSDSIFFITHCIVDANTIEKSISSHTV